MWGIIQGYFSNADPVNIFRFVLKIGVELGQKNNGSN